MQKAFWMSFKILRTTEFSNELKQLDKKHVSMRQDFANLIESLEANPVQGEALGANCYKVRVAIKSKGKGKSGGARAITCVYVADEELILVSIYDKSDQSTISIEEIKIRLKRFRK